MSRFFGDDGTEFNLKYIFDHVRNIGLCALIFGSGSFYVKGMFTGKSMILIDPTLAGYLLLLAGFGLMVLNSVHFSVVSVVALSQKVPKLLVGVPIFLITIWVQILAYYVLYSQISRIGS